MTTLHHIKAIATRTQATLIQDVLGATALAVMLVVGLHLPTLI